MFSWLFGQDPTHCYRCWRILAECDGHEEVAPVVAAPAEPAVASKDPLSKMYCPDWAEPVEKAK